MARGSDGVAQASGDVHADHDNACGDGHGRPRHAAVLLEPEMRHHADDADEDEGKRDVVEPRGRDPHAQGDGSDDIKRAEDGGGDPAERDQVHDRQHPRVVEEA